MRNNVLLAVSVFLLAVGATHADVLAWQQISPYMAPDFEAFFPDSMEGGSLLDALWTAKDRDSRPDEEIFEKVRNGLRHTTKRTEIVRWIGGRYIWGKSPQDPYAVEIMYHAADFSGENADPYGTRHYAVYFGLSVVENKSPAILKTLADLCMRVDDPNDLSRVAWGAEMQREELLGYFQPYLDCEDEAVRQKAQTCRDILLGKINAFEWATEKTRERAQKNYAKQLPEIKNALAEGDSIKRKETLRLVAEKGIALIMDDSFIPAFSSCANDPDEDVRQQVAVVVGGRWIWYAQPQNAEAIDLMLRLSHDSQRDVYCNAVYYGLSVVNNKSDKVIQRLLEMAFADRDPNLYGRIAMGLKQDAENTARILDQYITGNDKQVAAQAREVYEDMTGRKSNKQQGGPIP